MKNYKKILLVSSEFPPLPGGIGNHACNLALYLQKNGHDVGVIADFRSKNRDEEKDFDSSLPMAVFRIKRYGLIWITYLKRLVVYLKLAKKYDLIIASGKFPLWMVGLDPFSGKSKKTAVIHGSEVNLKGIGKILINRSLRGFNKIIAVSNFTKQLVHTLNLPNIAVIPNGFEIQTENVQTKNLNNDKAPVLITVGNVTERKGQLNVIKALPLLREQFPGIHYHIVGIPTQRDAFEREAALLGVGPSITFHGKVSESKKHDLLQKSDIFIMLSERTATGDVEGFGIAIVEANAHSLPAIGSSQSGIEDAIKEGYSGKLVAPKAKEEFVQALEEIMIHYDIYSKNALQWSKKFHWAQIIKEYLSILEL